ncbi:hypothetical protein NX722_23545 [Endozoicomonas gorgoniicola]|uniref:WYL domain-containing protein n=1 Tax=Endozoicomonas gorgoniicola TaxID=1234144 RepID=A0ABT3N1N0_9GAMM|nr:hypothetical protein [Endozoicomonas gorgoniicola]MCW7555542.1 hypothetical protein [Endozoicomonas gorgoniicola]
MAAKHTKNLVATLDSYQDRQGQTRTRRLTVGRVFEREDGSEFIRLDCFPVQEPKWNGTVNIYPVKRREEQYG